MKLHGNKRRTKHPIIRTATTIQMHLSAKSNCSHKRNAKYNTRLHSAGQDSFCWTCASIRRLAFLRSLLKSLQCPKTVDSQGKKQRCDKNYQPPEICPMSPVAFTTKNPLELSIFRHISTLRSCNSLNRKSRTDICSKILPEYELHNLYIERRDILPVAAGLVFNFPHSLFFMTSQQTFFCVCYAG